MRLGFKTYRLKGTGNLEVCFVLKSKQTLIRDCLFSSNTSCKGNTSLDCKPVLCSYATVEQTTLYSDSHYIGIAGSHLLGV